MMLPTSIARVSVTASLALMAAAATAGSQPPTRSHTLAGVSYVIRVGGAPATGNGMAAAMPSQTPNYTANAIFAAGRGRLDVVDGGVESLFTKGDYVLFDSTDLVIVHPATHEFIALPQDAASRRMDQLQARGMKLSISDVKVSMDSLPGTDTIAGHPTRRFRMTTAFTMTVDAGALQQRLTTESVTDYWTATVPGLPGNPLLRANGFSGSPATTGMFKDLSSRIDSAAAQIGSAVALRTVTSSRLTQGLESTLQMQQTSEVSDLKNREVDESLLLLPPGYKPGAVPGLDTAEARDAGAKWRVRPKG